MADLLQCGLATLLPKSSALREPRAMRQGDCVLLTGSVDDDRLGKLHERARALGNPTWMFWTAGRSVAAVFDDGASRPCARCALLFDRTFATPGARARSAAAAAAEQLRRHVADLVVRMMLPGGQKPVPGIALMLGEDSTTLIQEPYAAHPSCSCAEKGAARAKPPPALDVNGARDRRFAPVWALPPYEGRPLCRVLFRKSRSPWPNTGVEFGAATATGPKADERALAEAIERFCMLHAPPDRSAVSATELEEPTLGGPEIRSLLFRDEERDAPGFRFGGYDERAPHDWTWIERCSGRRRVLVPTSLVGRPGPKAARLVDATSNGYAAHRDPGQALTRALLEVIERDAVLLTWHLGLPAVRLESPPVDSLPGAVEVHAFLVTQDVDVPVILLLALREDGSLRSAAGAGASFEEAWERATLEMRAACSTPLFVKSEGPERYLGATQQVPRPEDHFVYYQDGARARAAIHHIQPRREGHRGSLRSRWPEARGGLGTVLDALARAGLDAWFARRSLPVVFGEGWHVVRALIPGAVELSWGPPYRRLASPRVERHLRAGRSLSLLPHPIA